MRPVISISLRKSEFAAIFVSVFIRQVYANLWPSALDPSFDVIVFATTINLFKGGGGGVGREPGRIGGGRGTGGGRGKGRKWEI